MTRLRFLACAACETVFAHPDASAVEESCAVCGEGRLREITDRLDGDAYFAPETARER